MSKKWFNCHGVAPEEQMKCDTLFHAYATCWDALPVFMF
ncbi:umuDC operon protein [Salmonella bongori CFSAN000509]|uniref:UmuDC operon protein n=1 Tax=Salmonella bongori serovar 44:r:- TaxID=1967585 RepID=A0A702BL01_SALBN|nr:hypothetical protein N643_20045 [Salmonella bongori serovar 48:z41:-- str. RKS3044]EGS1128082.1 umuDC operon protein [Salmonella bongori CFSAN000509]HAC6693555.1 umuDC operon protein [Salmonella bongori serovar 44:r:-]